MSSLDVSILRRRVCFGVLSDTHPQHLVAGLPPSPASWVATGATHQGLRGGIVTFGRPRRASRIPLIAVESFEASSRLPTTATISNRPSASVLDSISGARLGGGATGSARTGRSNVALPSLSCTWACHTPDIGVNSPDARYAPFPCATATTSVGGTANSVESNRSETHPAK